VYGHLCFDKCKNGSHGCISALVNETHVTQSAFVRNLQNGVSAHVCRPLQTGLIPKPTHFFELARVDRIQLATRRIVYHVKQGREALTQIETAATAMTNIKHPAHFLKGTNSKKDEAIKRE